MERRLAAREPGEVPPAPVLIGGKAVARWSAADLREFEDRYYARMVRDLGREIELQRQNPNAVVGNMLCALGLVVYTEVLGRIAVGATGKSS